MVMNIEFWDESHMEPFSGRQGALESESGRYDRDPWPYQVSFMLWPLRHVYNRMFEKVKGLPVTCHEGTEENRSIVLLIPNLGAGWE